MRRIHGKSLFHGLASLVGGFVIVFLEESAVPKRMDFQARWGWQMTAAEVVTETLENIIDIEQHSISSVLVWRKQSFAEIREGVVVLTFFYSSRQSHDILLMKIK